MNLIRGTESVEILCLNNHENFKFNKEFLLKRINEETNRSILKLLKLEIQQFENIQIQTATARSFLTGIHIRKIDDKEIRQDISMLEKTFKQQVSTMQKLSR